MKPSVMTLSMLPPHLSVRPDIRETYRQVRSAGVDYVDVSTADLMFADLGEIKDALAATGLRVSSFIRFIQSPRLDRDPRLARSEACEGVDIARELGADIFMYAPAGYAATVAVHTASEVADRLAADLRPVVGYGNAMGIKVAVEDAPEPRLPICRSKDMRSLLDAVPGLSLVYDTANMVFGGDDPIQFLELTRDRVVGVHLKDIGPATDGAVWVDVDLNGRRLSPTKHGAGLLDLPGIITALRVGGYDKFVCLELPFLTEGEQPEAVVVEALEYFKTL